jgi:hypothetical protein
MKDETHFGSPYNYNTTYNASLPIDALRAFGWG